MNTSDDLISRVHGENYEETVKKFEIVRVVVKSTFTPLVGKVFLFEYILNSLSGFLMDRFSKLKSIRKIDYSRRDAIILIPVTVLGKGLN